MKSSNAATPSLPLRLVPLLALVLAQLACTEPDSSPGGTAGLPTVVDSTADTVFARVDGTVPMSALRAVTVEMRIAPAIDDTSLFADVTTFAVDQAGRIWLFDSQSSRLFLFDSAGALVRRIGRRGSGPGEFASGSGIVVLPDTGVAIWDPQNARISFFSSSGDFRHTWLTPSGFSTNDGLHTDRSGTLFLKRPVTPPREGEILGRMGLVRLSDQGTFLDSLAPVDLPVSRDTYLAVRPDGNGQSSTSSSFAPNYYWDWHPDGHFVAGHGGRYEMIVERRDAKPVVIRRSPAAVAIAPDERDEEKARITWQMRRVQPGWTWQGPDIPESKAPLLGLTVTRDGNIWARVAARSERIPTDEIPPAREDGPPVRHFRTPFTYEVFAPDGRFLGRVPMPPRTSLVEADGLHAWGVTRDEDDLPAVVRFRIDPPIAAR